MGNGEIAKVFENIAGLLEIEGESPFKVRAYRRAAREIQLLPVDLRDLAEAGTLQSVPGIGEEIEKKILELLETGRLQYYERLRSRFPEGLPAVMDVPGIGPKLAARLWKELGIGGLEALEEALQDGRLAMLPRLGEKTAQNLLRELAALKARQTDRVLLAEARPFADAIVRALKERGVVIRAEAAGSLRRWRETVGDIDIIASAADLDAATEVFTRLPLVSSVIARGEHKASVRLHSGLQVDLLVKPDASYASLLQHFTGSKEHNVLLRERARRMGLSISEYGIKHEATGRVETFPDEDAIYQRLGLQYIPPELREGGEEISLAEQGRLPDLVRREQIRGDLHAHTEWSDGQLPIAAMARAAQERGYEYLAVTDHSVGLGVARGLSPERLAEQVRIVREVDASMGGDFRLLTGAEVDIRSDGTLDFPDEVLAWLDVVVISIHSAMGQDIVRMTDRLVRAMHNPYSCIVGHPTARLLGVRDPVQLDMEAVFEAALETGTALEVNASPQRLDLRDVYVRRAVELGVPLVISTDAHHPDNFDLLPYGVATARRGWATAANVLNTRTVGDLLRALHGSRPVAAGSR